MIENLSHHLLVAMPMIGDAFFARSVVYLVQHDEEGVMGVIVNKPVAMTWDNLMRNLDIATAPNPEAPPLVFGGPVMRERGFVLHPEVGRWESSLNNEHWGITTSRDILQAVVSGNGPEQVQICLGYAGWTHGQLEQELAENAWLALPATTDLVFDIPPYERYNAALTALGIDISQLSAGGHA
ncbi:MAG: YqgE/AlgH family protein [Natronospirillum sp.]